MFNLFQQPQTRSPRSYQDLVEPSRKRRWYSDFDDIFGRDSNQQRAHQHQQQQLQRRKRLRMEKEIYQEQLRQQERERQERLQLQEEANYRKQMAEAQYRQQLEEEQQYRQQQLEEKQYRYQQQQYRNKMEQKRRQEIFNRRREAEALCLKQQQEKQAQQEQAQEQSQEESQEKSQQEQEYENDGSVLPFWKDFLSGMNQPATPTETEVPVMKDDLQKVDATPKEEIMTDEPSDNVSEAGSDLSESSVSSIYSNEDIKVIDAIRQMGEKVSNIKLPEGPEISATEYFKIDGSLTALLVNLDNLDISEETRSLRKIIMRKINLKLEKLDGLKKN